jgi:hypothetical protein
VSRYSALATQCCGFALDAVISLVAVIYWAVDPVYARAFGAIAGLMVVLTLNRTRLIPQENRWLANAISIIAVVFSIALYTLLLTRNPFIQPSVALGASILSALMFSTFGYVRFLR